MSKIVRKGVIARPGTFNFSWGTETKTAEELKQSVERQHEVMLTMGHPAGEIGLSDYIGRVDQIWNEEEQLVEGIFNFYDDKYWDNIPENIQEKVLNKSPLSISAGYSVDDVVNDDQNGIFYHHIALLRDGENPACPLGTCGINIRRESKGTMSKQRYEQSSEISEPEKVTTEPEIIQLEESSPVDELKAEVEALKAQIAEMNASQREQEKTEEVTPEESELTEKVDESDPIPETVIPAGAAKTRSWIFNESGNMETNYQPRKSV